jgi:hypothetical protein
MQDCTLCRLHEFGIVRGLNVLGDRFGFELVGPVLATPHDVAYTH